MSAEALARVLCSADGLDPDARERGAGPLWERYQAQAARILADPGPLLAALAEAGLPTKGDPCPCGCPRTVEPKPHVHFWGYTMAPIEVCECGARRATEPEPESVTVTLPVGVTRSEVVVVERKRLEDVVLYPGSSAAQASARILRDGLETATGSQS